MKQRNKLTFYILGVMGSLLFAIWLIWVSFYNRRLKELDLVPVENYEMNTFVELDNNYCYGSYYDGISICVNDYEIVDTDVYLKDRNMTEDVIDYWTDKLCIVDTRIRYRKKETQAETDIENTNIEFDASVFFMCGQNYYEGQNIELYFRENSTDTTLLRLNDVDEYAVKLVFNIDNNYYTHSTWQHIENLPRMLYITASPVQRNIILHD